MMRKKCSVQTVQVVTVNGSYIISRLSFLTKNVSDAIFTSLIIIKTAKTFSAELTPFGCWLNPIQLCSNSSKKNRCKFRKFAQIFELNTEGGLLDSVYSNLF